MPPECKCLAAIEVAEEEEEEEEKNRSEDNGRENSSPAPETVPAPSSSSSSSSVVLGALDIRPPFSAGGGHPAGVPLGDERGCAVLNVAVLPSSRRRGVARTLLSSAADLAAKEWGARALYTTVAATKAGARALYADFGFVEVETESGSGVSGSSPPILIGRELLLRAEL